MFLAIFLKLVIICTFLPSRRDKKRQPGAIRSYILFLILKGFYVIISALLAHVHHGHIFDKDHTIYDFSLVLCQ